MVYIVVLMSLALGWISATLLWRLHTAAAPIAKEAGQGDGADFGACFARFLDHAVDASLAPEAGANGMAGLELRFREPQDPSRTVGELASRISAAKGAVELQSVVNLLKSLYQLQYTLQAPAEELNECLGVLSERLKSSSLSPRPVGRVEVISTGALLDRNRMMPLNNGTHVAQPFGAIIFDREGKVLSKAKVLCS